MLLWRYLFAFPSQQLTYYHFQKWKVFDNYLITDHLKKETFTEKSDFLLFILKEKMFLGRFSISFCQVKSVRQLFEYCPFKKRKKY